MRRVVLIMAALALWCGYAYADSIDDEIMAEALRVTGEHKAKVDAEEQAQKEKD
jgi:hypothetical protein